MYAVVNNAPGRHWFGQCRTCNEVIRKVTPTVQTLQIELEALKKQVEELQRREPR